MNNKLNLNLSPKHYTSVFSNEQELLKVILKIHIKTETFDLDPMFFKGNFYKEIPQPKYKFDINPLILGVEKANAIKLSLTDKSINSIILDPPFMFGIHGKTKDYYSSMTHGIFKDFNELENLYRGIIKEAYRLLKKGGCLVFKCQDYTDNKTTMTHCLVWKWALEQGFYPKDLAILNLPKNKVSNPNLEQRHLRKIHSYFWIFNS